MQTGRYQRSRSVCTTPIIMLVTRLSAFMPQENMTFEHRVAPKKMNTNKWTSHSQKAVKKTANNSVSQQF